MTGADFYNYLNQSIDKNYSEYLQETEANRLILTSMYNLTEKIYKENFTQKTYDEITNLIVTEYPATILRDFIWLYDIQITNVVLVGATVTVTTARRHFLQTNDSVNISGVLGDVVTNINGTFTITVGSTTEFSYIATTPTLTNYTANSGIVGLSSKLPNYQHLLAVKTEFQTGTSKSVTAVKTGSTTEFTIPAHNFRNGDLVNISVSGVSGGFSGVEVTVINKNKISVAVTSAGTYTSGGTASLIYNNYAQLYTSDAKASQLYTPSYTDPRVSISEGFLKILPTGASSATVDYLRTPPVTIDVEDTIIDLELYFNNKFLFRLVDEATFQFGAESRDEGRMQTAAQDMAINP